MPIIRLSCSRFLRETAIRMPVHNFKPNYLCLLPNTALRVTTWEPHPCGGYYISDDMLYGPHGSVGRYMGQQGSNNV